MPEPEAPTPACGAYAGVARLLIGLLIIVLPHGSAVGGPTQTVVPNRNAQSLPPARFQVEEILRIGRADHPPEYVLASVPDLDVDPLDRLIVLDEGDRQVKVYSSAGEFVRSYGGEGQGPGEMIFPQRLAVTRSGDVYVYDSDNRLLVFDSTGRHIHTRRALPGLGVATGMVVAPDSSVFISGFIRFLEERGVIHRLSSQLEYVASFGERRSFSDRAIERLLGPSYAAGRLTWAPDGSLWYSQLNPYLLRKFDPEGVALLEVHRPNDFMFPLEEAYQHEDLGDRARAGLGPFAHTVQLLALPDGTVMNQIYDEPNERFVIDFFDSEGTFIGGVATYAHAVFAAYDSELNLYSYVVQDFPQIVKYRITSAP